MMNEIHIYDLIRWIDRNLEASLSVESISRKSGYSKWYLQSMFKNVRGVPLGTYVRTRRLEMAARDLVCSNQSILDVAIKYHFDCQQSFTRAFKRHYQITPGNYRKTNQGHTLGYIESQLH